MPIGWAWRKRNNVSLLGDSVALLNAGLKAAGGEEVTYRRGNQAIDRLVAVPAAAKNDESGEGIVSVTSRDRDWIIWAADLVKAGQRWLPERGDQIIWTDAAGVIRAFAVLPRHDDRVFRPTDPTELQLRVFTVETNLTK